jgi:alpha-tubulin suppressor-like RCC1 family protein
MTKTALSGMRVITLILGMLLPQIFSSSPAEALTLRVPPRASEGSGVLSNAGTVSIPSALPSDLVIQLSSSDPTQLTLPKSVVLRAGETSASFDIRIQDDREVEGARSIVITASAENGCTAEEPVTVEDNDPGRLQFSAASYSVGERERTAVITVLRSASSSGEVSVDYEAVNGTASAGEDYEGTPGTLDFHEGEVSKTFSVSIFDNSVAEGDKTVTLNLSNPKGGAVLGIPSTAILTIQDDDRIDSFTEIFEQEDNDLRNQTLIFVPDRSKSFYTVCKTPAFSFPTDPSGGTVISFTDDSYAAVRLDSGAEIPFYGVRYQTFFIGSNGYVTFSSGDVTYQESLATHFSQPRISALFDDLNPSHGGKVSWKQLADRAVVTFQAVPKNHSGKGNSFQIEIFFDGTLRLTYLDIALRDGLAGLSRGGGIAAEFAESDLSRYPACFFLSLPESVTEGKDTDVAAPATLGALFPPPTDLEIRMTSSDPTELSVEKTLVFPAGENSFLFDLTTVDDDLLDGTQTVTITATLPGGGSISGVVRVDDNESATLTVEVPKTAREGDGRFPARGVVRTNAPVDKDVQVFLSSDDPSEATVPETVTIPKGQSSAHFDLVIEDDVVVDGPQTVTITASVPGWSSGCDTLVVFDDREDARFAPSIAAGDYHSMALDDDGMVWAWGDNRSAQLADGGTTNRTVPAQVSSLSNVFAVAGGGNHTLALTGDGRVWAWGDNSSGQLGDGTLLARARPAPVPQLTEAVAVAAGHSHSVALKKDGTVWAWGDNSAGQLGDGRTENSTAPVKVLDLTGITAIAAGLYHNLALKKDGTLWAWGANGDGQLGDGSLCTRTLPVQVSGLSAGVAIAAGGYHSLAIQRDRHLWAWGRNWEGQLGDTPSDHTTSPVPVTGLSGIISIAAGTSHSLALKSNETVWAWGENDHGQLGNGTFQASSTPVQVSDLIGVIGLAAGSNHSLSLRNDGTVWAWGENGSGQLGDGTFGSQKVPVQTMGSSEQEALDLISLSLVVPQRVTEGAAGVLVGKGAVILKGVLHRDLEVALTSSNPSEVSVPVGMVIPAGQTSASFDLTVLDDSLLDGPQPVRVTAFALGYVPAGATMEVDDNESAILSVEVPALVTESDGRLPLRGRVRLSAPPDRDITVYLSAEGSAHVTVPATAVIMAGETSAPFSIRVFDDKEVNGSRETLITAMVPGWVADMQRIEVEDDEFKVLFIGAEVNNAEGGRSGSRRGIVTIPTPLSDDLVVDLFSDDPSEVVLPSFVIIPAGETVTTFDFAAAESGEADWSDANLTASAPGWSRGEVTIRQKNNEPGRF